MFTNLNGDPMAPERLTRTFRALATGAGLPPVRRRPGAAAAGAGAVLAATWASRRTRRSRADAARQIGRPRLGAGNGCDPGTRVTALFLGSCEP